MKRLHVHIAVESIDQSVDFYSTLFAAAPSVLRGDYAKWMLDDPLVNFAISSRGRQPGVDHLGLQVEDRSELGDIAARLKAADQRVFEQGDTACCYAKSEKAWVLDPSGISWETFLTIGTSTTYGEEKQEPVSGCCMPDLEALGANQGVSR